MKDSTPIACSLNAGDLERRLAEIAAVGATSLISRETHAASHRLRFRKDQGTRQALEGIVAAESKCCPFLDLLLEERDSELVLCIAAPRDATALADELARAFGS